MEDNFYLDDFELSLKEQANQFKMTPSKKVWHGIYNDMHPGRRWPSITISLLLVISIVFVGYINTHNDKVLVLSKQQTSAEKDIAKEDQINLTNGKLAVSEKAHESRNIAGVNFDKQLQDLAIIPSEKAHDQNNNIQTATSLPTPIDNSSQIKSSNGKVDQTTATTLLTNMENKPAVGGSKNVDAFAEKPLSNPVAITSDNAITQTGLLKLSENNNNITGYESTVANGFEDHPIYANNISVNGIRIIPVSISGNTPADNSTSATETQKDNKVLLSANVLIPEDEELNIKARQKQKSKTTWLFYAGPFLNSVSFSGNHLTETNNQNSLSLPQVTQKDNRVMHNSAIGFEAGIQMNYLFAKKLQFTTGAHFTRSGYDLISNEVHPALTTLLLKDKATGDQYSRNFVTHYGDGHGQSTTTLRNYSFQVSVPVGLQYQLFGNNKIQFNLGVNVEPSLVLKSNSYIMSSDGRNYVSVPDLYRKWNLNSNFTPFITFKSDKFKWNLGPVVRYQWLSSYTADYTIKEHLINYGIRVGISK